MEAPLSGTSSPRIVRFSTFEVNLHTGELRQRGQRVKLQFLVVASVGFSQTPAGIGPKPQVAISVYDYAHISTELLTAAEKDAERIFREAGVQTVWTTCLPKSAESDGCYMVNANHLVLKILPRAIAAHVRDRGDVLTHEIGHLLLGSNSHSVSGIMSAHWYGEELRRISEATMFFTSSQSRMMRDRVASHQVEVPEVPHRTADGSSIALTEAPLPGLATTRE